MTPQMAAARARAVWSDLPVVKNTLLVGGMVAAVATFAVRWGPLPGQVQRNTERVGTLEVEMRQLRRESAFSACRWQDSTIPQCLPHLRNP